MILSLAIIHLIWQHDATSCPALFLHKGGDDINRCGKDNGRFSVATSGL